MSSTQTTIRSAVPAGNQKLDENAPWTLRIDTPPAPVEGSAWGAFAMGELPAGVVMTSHRAPDQIGRAARV